MNPNIRVAILILNLVLLALLTHESNGQETDANVPSQTFQKLDIVDGALSGPGTAALLQSCRSSHFILFGEAHGVAGVAEMVAATNRSLSTDRFHHLVIEAGDWFSQQLAVGNTDDVLNRFPYSLAFDYNGDLELIQQVKSAGQDRELSVIGVDQEACAIHVFDFLSAKAQTFSARQLSKCLMLKSLFQGGKYIRTDYQQDLDQLILRLGKDTNSIEVVNSLQQSMNIFVDHVEGRINDSVQTRETRMMKRFDLAVNQLPSDSRFIFKMGGAHTIRGIGPNGVKTLGEYVAEHAKKIGKQSLHISIYPWQIDSAISLPQEFQEHRYVLVNSPALLTSLRGDATESDSELVQQLKQCDWIILMPNSESANKSMIRSKQKQFVRNQLIRFGLILVPILFLTPIYVGSLRMLFGFARGKASDYSFLFTLPFWFSIVLIGLIAVQVLLLLRAPGSATPTSHLFTMGLDLVFVALIAGTIGGGIKLQKGTASEGKGQVIYWMGTVGCTGLILFIKYWGLGNLLGF